MVAFRCSFAGFDGAVLRGWLVALSLGVGLSGSLLGCGDGCDEGWRKVCDEQQSSCFCGAECAADSDCASGEYCLESSVCVGVYVDLADELGCGREGQECCQVSPEGRAVVDACLRGLRCDGDTGTCVL
ncbi:MAG: hypothetical protein JRI23_06490 [Deltaproteobacteria bacterium]|jgi:hypothetical protein|nr:hypothetical protein [Deltaproteobacteria bacterium]MBW2531230.1 hypothetical protein [Deltaproteobacteria bacterium]